MKKGRLAIIDADAFLFYAGYHYREHLNLTGEMGVKAKIDTLISKTLEVIGATHYIGFFGMHGSENFRHKFATLKPYKGSRDNPDWQDFFKPIAKKYYAEKWKFHGVSQIEADDAVVIAFNLFKDEYDVVVVSEDKDSRQMGAFSQWNPKTRKMVHSTQEEGRKFFWGQCLTGDSTDNIPGVKGIGEGDKKHPALTTEMIARGEVSRNKDVMNLWAMDNPSEEEMFNFVKAVYQRVYPTEWEYHFLENYVLLTMMKKPCFDYPMEATPILMRKHSAPIDLTPSALENL